MSLYAIKESLERLCYDIQCEIPSDADERIKRIRRSCIDSPQWIEKNSHMRTDACGALGRALFAAEVGSDEARWFVNVAQGCLEEAVRIDEEERRKGIPKPLITKAQFDAFSEWSDTLETGWFDNHELYAMYEQWMEKNAPEEDVLSVVAFGKRLAKEEWAVQKRKKVDGETLRGWSIE